MVILKVLLGKKINNIVVNKDKKTNVEFVLCKWKKSTSNICQIIKQNRKKFQLFNLSWYLSTHLPLLFIGTLHSHTIAQRWKMITVFFIYFLYAAPSNQHHFQNIQTPVHLSCYWTDGKILIYIIFAFLEQSTYSHTM